jgi:hypothetical protein
MQTDRNGIPHYPRHIVVLSGVSKKIFEPVVYLAQTVHLSCFKLALSPNRQTEHPLVPHHLGVPSGASKMISEPMVRLAQTMHLSCTDTNTISKRIEMRFHKTHVTKVFYRVCLKQFSSLWYVRRKPCTYLGSTLAQSPNRPKRAST